MSRIFLSHSSRDNFAAIAVRDWLAREGWNEVFLDLDPDRGIVAGERWERALHEAATRCEAVVFLVSGAWLASPWCDTEYALARGLNKKLLAVLIDPKLTIAGLPPKYTGTWQVVDLTSGQDLRVFRVPLPGSHEEAHVRFSADGLTRLKRGLEKAGLDPKFFAWPPETEPQRAPYRGLKPLEAEDAGIFFGRGAPIVEATDRLRGLAAGAAPRLLVLLGASGAGKSSFLRAGLLPRLARDDAHFLPLAPIRPERAALTGDTGFLGALAKAFPERALGDLRTALSTGAAGVRPLLAILAQAAFRRTLADDTNARPPAVVVTIDQAEELFRPDGAAEGVALLDLVHDLTTIDDPTVIVIFAIRSDSYDALMRATSLHGLRQETQPLPPMPRGAYADVIEGPTKRVVESGGRLAIEPRLTQRLLEDIEKGGGSDALPLLAFTLEQLYLEYRAAGTLGLDHYEALGGLRGAIDKAVARAFVRADADGRIPRERAARETLLRRGLIPWLAGIDPDTKSPRRNIARLADIPAEAAPLINLLVEERLLSTDVRIETDPTTGAVTRTPTIEPTHEALLRQWGLLDGWLQEDFSRLATLEGVQRAARDWDANARGEAWLSHGGERLATAQALDERPDLAAKLDPTDRAYLAGCRAKEDAARGEAETRRAEREAEQARRLADARKLTRATAIGLVAALVLAGAAGGAAWYAENERSIAERQTVEARNQRQMSMRSLALVTHTSNELVFDLIRRFRNVTGVPASMINAILDQALGLQQKLIDSGQDTISLQRNQSVALNQAVTVLLALGHLDEALTDASKSLAIMTKLVRLQPKNRAWQDDLANSVEKRGDALRQLGRPTEALAAYARDKDITQALAADETDTAAKHDMTIIFGKIGEVLMQNGDQRGAIAAFDQEFEMSLALVKARSEAQFKRDEFLSYINLADAERRYGDLGKASATYEQALHIARPLTGNGENAQSERDLAIGLQKAGEVRLLLNDVESATSDFEDAHRIDEILAGDKSSSQAQRDLAINFYDLGNAKLQDDLKGSFSNYQQGLSILETTAADQNNIQAQRDLAIGLQKFGDAKLWNSDAAGAVRFYKQERKIFEKLAGNTSNVQAQRGFAESLAKIGLAERAAGDPVAALDVFRESLAVRHKLAISQLKLQQGGLIFDLECIASLERALGHEANARQAEAERQSITQTMQTDVASRWEWYTRAAMTSASDHKVPMVEVEEFEQKFGNTSIYEREQSH